MVCNRRLVALFAVSASAFGDQSLALVISLRGAFVGCRLGGLISVRFARFGGNRNGPVSDSDD